MMLDALIEELIHLRSQLTRDVKVYTPVTGECLAEIKGTAAISHTALKNTKCADDTWPDPMGIIVF